MSKPVLFILVTFSVLHSFISVAQVERPLRAPEGQIPTAQDTLDFPTDSVTNETDTLQVEADSVRQAAKKDIETTILYSARDSINSTFSPKIVKLYGEAKIKYGTIELEAEEIVIDYDNSTISANGRLDSTGRRVGFPIFKDAGAVYETREMMYNFKSKRAQITEVVTQQGDGYIHGQKVFKNDENELFSIQNAYTTCNLADPHFRIISRKSKAIPDDKIVSGPFYMELNHVPTPLGFPFAIFPQQRESASGIIFPTYGEEKVRGFFLRGGGYFFDISDYMNLTITSDIYTKGSNALMVNSQYRKRYKHNGSVTFNLTNNKLSPDIEKSEKIHDFRLTWSHSPQTKGTGRFAASVNIATASYTKNNYLGVNSNPESMRVDATTRKLTSNVSYSKTFAGTPFSLGTNLRVNQDLATSQVDLPFPDLSFNMNNVYPFKNSDSYFLSNINFRLGTAANNLISNNVGRTTNLKGEAIDSIAPFTPENIPQFFRDAKKGVRHDFPLSTSFKLLRFFTFSPSVSLRELWYFDKLTWGLNEDSSDLEVIDTVHQFNRVTNYNGSISMNTRIYGTWVNKKRDARLKAIRHVVNPSASFTFQPDFGDPKYDYYQTDSTKTGRVIQKSRHEGFVYGSSDTQERRSLNLSLGNVLEMKVRKEKDTVDRKISLLNSLSVSTAYNFAADSFKLAPFGLSANTNVLSGKLNINIGGVLDPYIYRFTSVNENDVVFQRKIDKFVWSEKKAIGQLTNFNLALSTNLSPKGRDKDQSTREKIASSNIPEADKQFLMNNPDAYVDFEIPWNLRISYIFDYTKAGFNKQQITQSLRFSGDLSVTEKWKVDFNSGYDFVMKAFTTTNIGIRRDLHCWHMAVNWVPFGRFQQYNFSIGVKAGILQDLKLDRQRAFQDVQ